MAGVGSANSVDCVALLVTAVSVAATPVATLSSTTAAGAAATETTTSLMSPQSGWAQFRVEFAGGAIAIVIGWLLSAASLGWLNARAMSWAAIASSSASKCLRG